MAPFGGCGGCEESTLLCLCDYLHILHLRMSVWVSLPVEVLGLLVISADFVVPVGVVSSSLVWRAPSGQ